MENEILGEAHYLNPKEPDFRLDFLTTLHRGGDAPYEHPQLHITLQPLKFMEYSLESIQQAVLFCDEGAVLGKWKKRGPISFRGARVGEHAPGKAAMRSASYALSWTHKTG